MERGNSLIKALCGRIDQRGREGGREGACGLGGRQQPSGQIEGGLPGTAWRATCWEEAAAVGQTGSTGTQQASHIDPSLDHTSCTEVLAALRAREDQGRGGAVARGSAREVVQQHACACAHAITMMQCNACHYPPIHPSAHAAMQLSIHPPMCMHSRASPGACRVVAQDLGGLLGHAGLLGNVEDPGHGSGDRPLGHSTVYDWNSDTIGNDEDLGRRSRTRGGLPR